MLEVEVYWSHVWIPVWVLGGVVLFAGLVGWWVRGLEK